MDSRDVQRTRRLLLNSLIDLILERGYETITVQDIIDRANVGRSTFYAHFQDKEDLLFSGFENFRTQYQGLNDSLTRAPGIEPVHLPTSAKSTTALQGPGWKKVRKCCVVTH
jgi:AcrR family transcriptional regulator